MTMILELQPAPAENITRECCSHDGCSECAVVGFLACRTDTGKHEISAYGCAVHRAWALDTVADYVADAGEFCEGWCSTNELDDSPERLPCPDCGSRRVFSRAEMERIWPTPAPA